MFETHLGPPAQEAKTLVILVCDTPVDAVFEKHGTYHDVFCELFDKALKVKPALEAPLHVVGFDVVHGEYPPDEVMQNAAGVLLTGSAASAYALIPWVEELIKYMSKVPTRFPDTKIIGICFGHQIVGAAFGGRVVKNSCWELGVFSMTLTDLGRQLLAEDQTDLEATIQEVHQDHVPEMPPNFVNLGYTKSTPYQGFVRFREGINSKEFSDRDAILSAISIFTLQGHPEFTTDIVVDIIKVREDRGVFTKNFADFSRSLAAKQSQGVYMGRLILDILGLRGE